MKRNISITGVRRKQLDEEKLALAFLLLARSQHDARQERASPTLLKDLSEDA